MSHPKRQTELSLSVLCSRLVDELSQLLTSGEVTERKLAARLGMSQPHLNNILSGKRKLTSVIADQVLDRLGRNVLDLLDASELTVALEKRNASARRRQVPFSSPGAGPDVLFPGSLDEEHPVPTSWLAQVARPAVISLRHDPEMDPLLLGGERLLVDQGRESRLLIAATEYYIVRHEGASLIRRLRDSGRGVYLVSEKHALDPARWPHVLCPEDGQLTEIIQAKVIACLRPPAGTFQSLVPPSGAN